MRPDLTIVSDDNYCALKAYGIAAEYGADYSTFSGFKVLGPEGIGVIAGKMKQFLYYNIEITLVEDKFKDLKRWNYYG